MTCKATHDAGRLFLMQHTMRFASPSMPIALFGRGSSHEMYKHIWHRSLLLLLRRTSSTSCTCMVVKTKRCGVPHNAGPTITVKTAGDALHRVEKKTADVQKYVPHVYTPMLTHTDHVISSHFRSQGRTLAVCSHLASSKCSQIFK